MAFGVSFFSLFVSLCGICLFPSRWRRRKAGLLPVPSENVIEDSIKTSVNWQLSALISLDLRDSMGASPRSCFIAGRINPAQDSDLHKKKSAAWKKRPKLEWGKRNLFLSFNDARVYVGCSSRP